MQKFLHDAAKITFCSPERPGYWLYQMKLHVFFSFSIGTQVEAEHVLNRLWIGQAEKNDSGNYSCTIPGYEKTNFPRARVRVHVMDGKGFPYCTYIYAPSKPLLCLFIK